jgi:hypothetical protein
MTHGAAVLEFMLGAGVLVHIFAQSLDRTINKVKSDLCTMLRMFESASEQEARIQLERLRIATHDLVGEWVLTNQDPIMRLATLLLQSSVGDGRWGLSGVALRKAMLQVGDAIRFGCRAIPSDPASSRVRFSTHRQASRPNATTEGAKLMCRCAVKNETTGRKSQVGNGAAT